MTLVIESPGRRRRRHGLLRGLAAKAEPADAAAAGIASKVRIRAVHGARLTVSCLQSEGSVTVGSRASAGNISLGTVIGE